MKKTLIISLLNICFFVLAQSPGGVSGTTVWAKIEHTTTNNQLIFKNYSNSPALPNLNTNPITNGTALSSNYNLTSPELFNYNHSKTFNATINSNFSFLSKIETLPNATVFVVNKPNPSSTGTMALVSTNHVNHQHFQLSTDKFVRPFPNTYEVGFPNIPNPPSPRPNARINTLIWHNYNKPTIFNSFGVSGESRVSVGSNFGTTSSFNGDIAEVIMYPEALNDNQRLRVESYLAIKYGITLQPNVDYLSSKNIEIWNTENNGIFKNRIIGIGKDSNSNLHQRQSTSSHDLTNQLILSRSNTILSNNYPIPSTNSNSIADQNFILLGDNNKTQLFDTNNSSGITTMKRKWLVQNTGDIAYDLKTSLHYKPDPVITLAPNQAFWLIIDKNASNTVESNFTGNSISYYPVTTFSGGYASFINLEWGSDIHNFSQFTFGIGPKIMVNPVVQSMECNATTSNVIVSVSGGAPAFTAIITGLSPSNNNFLQTYSLLNHNFTLYNLPLGQYSISVYDTAGNNNTATFIVSPNPEVNINMNSIYNLQYITNPTIIDASTFIQGNISDYNIEWYSSNGYFSNNIELNIASLNVGTYQLTITNNNCVTIKTFVVIKNDIEVSPKITLFPNPSKGKFETQIDLAQIEDIHLDLYDSASKLLDTKHLTGNKSYNQKYELFTTGVYFLKVTSISHSETFKIIIN